METADQFYTRKFEEVCTNYGMSALEAIQPNSKTGYPIVKEIRKSEIVKVDINDPAFDKTYSELTKIY